MAICHSADDGPVGQGRRYTFASCFIRTILFVGVFDFCLALENLKGCVILFNGITDDTFPVCNYVRLLLTVADESTCRLRFSVFVENS